MGNLLNGESLKAGIFKPFLHRNLHANVNGENNIPTARQKRTLEYGKNLQEQHHGKPQPTDLTSSPLHAAFERF